MADNTFLNNLMLQSLAQGGAAIGGEGSFAAGINPMVQQNIQTQNFMKMMQQVLGPGVDFKSDATGKATISGNLNMPLESKGMAESIGTSTKPDATAGAGNLTPEQMLMMMMLNPQAVR